VKPPARKNCWAVQQPIAQAICYRYGRTDGRGLPSYWPAVRPGDPMALGHEQHQQLGGVEERAPTPAELLETRGPYGDDSDLGSASPPRRFQLAALRLGHNPIDCWASRIPRLAPGQPWRLAAGFMFCLPGAWAGELFPAAAHCLPFPRSLGPLTPVMR